MLSEWFLNCPPLAVDCGIFIHIVSQKTAGAPECDIFRIRTLHFLSSIFDRKVCPIPAGITYGGVKWKGVEWRHDCLVRHLQSIRKRQTRQYHPLRPHWTDSLPECGSYCATGDHLRRADRMKTVADGMRSALNSISIRSGPSAMTAATWRRLMLRGIISETPRISSACC